MMEVELLSAGRLSKGTLLGTPNREPQEYSRNIMEYKDPGRYVPIIYLLYSWGYLFGVPSRVPLMSIAVGLCARAQALAAGKIGPYVGFRV